MVHSGYEATAVNHTFSSFGGLWGKIKALLFNTYANPAAQQRLAQDDQHHREKDRKVALRVLSTSTAA
jgi:hypothetical protein